MNQEYLLFFGFHQEVRVLFPTYFGISCKQNVDLYVEEPQMPIVSYNLNNQDLNKCFAVCKVPWNIWCLVQLKMLLDFEMRKLKLREVTWLTKTRNAGEEMNVFEWLSYAKYSPRCFYT